MATTTVDERDIVHAAVRCVGRWGLAKTSVDDVAREAGVSRATVYRVFPGGKDRLVESLLQHEVRRFFEQVGSRLDAAETLEDLLTEGIAEALEFIAHHEALDYLLAHEPELVIPHLALGGASRFRRAAAAFTVPHLTRFLPPDDALDAADWVARLVLSYALDPSPAVDASDRSTVRRLVRNQVLPGIARH